MKRLTTHIMNTAIMLTATTLTNTASANLIVNGGFETNSVNTGHINYFGDVADGWTAFTDVFDGATPDMWSFTGNDGNEPGLYYLLYDAPSYEGDKWAALAGNIHPGLPGSQEGLESSPFELEGGVEYRVSLTMMYDDANFDGVVNPTPLTVRLRRNGAGISSVIGIFGANSTGQFWETRSLDFSVISSDSYTLILSNEAMIASYLSIDDVVLQPLASICSADLDGSGEIGFDDLILLLGGWGSCGASECPTDLDCSGAVGFDDIVILLGAWGPCE